MRMHLQQWWPRQRSITYSIYYTYVVARHASAAGPPAVVLPVVVCRSSAVCRARQCDAALLHVAQLVQLVRLSALSNSCSAAERASKTSRSVHSESCGLSLSVRRSTVARTAALFQSLPTRRLSRTCSARKETQQSLLFDSVCSSAPFSFYLLPPQRSHSSLIQSCPAGPVAHTHVPALSC